LLLGITFLTLQLQLQYSYLGYKVYRSFRRPTAEVVHNNIQNELPEIIEIYPVVKEVYTEKGKEVWIDLNVTSLNKKVALIHQVVSAT
jgi:hypothetical protein